MIVSELIQKRLNLQQEIVILMHEFETETGIKINDIEITRQTFDTGESVIVRIKVRLDI